MYEGYNFSTSSLTLVIICLFDYSHPSGCEVVLWVLGFVLIRYGKTPRDGNVVKEVYYTHRSLEMGGMAQSHMRKHQGQGGKGSRGEMWARAFFVVSAGRTGQGRVISRFRMD